MALSVPPSDGYLDPDAGSTPTRPIPMTREARLKKLARLHTWRVSVSLTSDLRRNPPGGSFGAAAEAAVRLAGHGISVMGLLPARPSTPELSSIYMVEQSDVYVGVVGQLYGSIVPDRPELSYTELEFETATRLGLPQLVFLVEGQVEHQEPELEARQQQFRRRLKDEAGVTVDHVETPPDLTIRLYHALTSLREELRPSRVRTRSR
jgi:Domain of unknown function (DUF4062)